ncbi:MAG: hypothetical protein WDO73_06335 [Ignavibacteriota bacterium]
MVAAVLSGNRNFEGRINPQVKANYLAVAAAGGGRTHWPVRWMSTLANDPLGTGSDGTPVYLRDIWPTNQEVVGHGARVHRPGDVPPGI